MPHRRDRLLLPLMVKRLRLWPVLGLLGPRQCGKSTLLRDIFRPQSAHEYVTMDSRSQRDRAENSPEAFARPDEERGLLVIDEIQKVPDLFDAVKLHVDEHRRPGMYVISGSTEFSRLTGIRESLTGRIGLLRLYPLMLEEIKRSRFGAYFLGASHARAVLSLHDFDRKIDAGGMPGLCFLRDRTEFEAACATWLETTCYRDLQQVKGARFDGALGLEILSELARSEEPTAHAVALKLRKDTRIIQRYLDAFAAILVLLRLTPHAAGIGKDQYLFCDCGLARHLGASRETALRTHVLIEALACFENNGLGRPLIKYYRNQKTSFVPLIFEWPAKRAVADLAVHIYDGETAERRELAALRAFHERLNRPMRLLLLNQTATTWRDSGGKKSPTVEIHPLRG